MSPDAPEGNALAARFFHDAPQPAVITTARGRLVEVNAAYTAHFGTHKAFGESLDEAGRAAFRRFTETLGEAPAVFLHAFPHPDGGTRRWAWEFFASGRRLFGRARAAGDLPEGGLLYGALFDSAAIGIAVLDPRGRIADANGAFSQLLGHARPDLLGARGLDLVHQQDRDRVRAEERRLMKRETDRYRLEVRLRKANRRRFWVVLTVSPIDLVPASDPDHRYFLATVENIHQRVKAEEHLQERARELQRSNAELQKFAFMASHDLQQPLRTVANFLQILERNHLDALDRDGQDLVRFAVAGSKRMQYLIRDLLQYSRVQTSPENLDTVDLNEVLEEVNRNLQDVAAQRGANVLNEYLPSLKASRTQMVQLFQNLVENAIKFGAVDRPPEVIVRAEDQPRQVHVSVQDNGIGIEPDYREKIFALFQRLHDPDEIEGTGIGLAVCQKIVENHGGRIWVESEPGRGATFHFTLRKAP
jgi:PAS domain S-box-containing protein